MPTESFSPEIQVPAKLWSKIFIYCRDAQRNDIDDDDECIVTTLSRVSRTFRDIVDTTPELWPRLYELTGSQLKHLPRFARTIRKTGALPLDFHIELPENISTENMTNIIALLEEIIPRFRSLMWSICSYRQERLLMDAFAECQMFPFLERLHLFGRYPRVAQDEHTTAFALGFRDAFRRCPRLAHVDLPDHFIPFITDPSFFSTVTSFSIQTSYVYPAHLVERVLELMSKMPTLQSLTFHLASVEVTPRFTLPDIVPLSTPQLRTVFLMALRPGLDILCLLHAPGLESLELFASLPSEGLTGRMEANLNLSQYLTEHLHHLSHTATSLTNLKLCDTPEFDYPGLIEGRIFPNLQYLHLGRVGISDDALKQCHPSKNLKRLEFNCCPKLSLLGVMPFVELCTGMGVDVCFTQCEQICGCWDEMHMPRGLEGYQYTYGT